MKPAPFRYADPGTLDEALAVLSDEGEGAKVLAGGQSLLPLLSMRLAAPTTLVDINRVPGLDTVETTGDGVTVGALVRHNRLLGNSPDAMAAARVQPLLARATANVAHPAIRNRGTTVGSIAHADPSGEMTAVLALTDGSVTVATPGGVVVEQVVVPDERSDRHAVPGGLDGVETGHPVDVHQGGRCREPHGEQREQRLAAGEHLGALTL